MNGSPGARSRPQANAGQKQIPLDTQAANAVFRASPRQLQQYLAAKYAPALPNEVEDTEEDLEETELDDYDEEGWPENDELHEGTLEQPMGPSPFDVEEPACDRSDLYIIAVDQDKEGVCSCTSLAHSWMAGDYPDEEFLLGTLGVFLEATAAWLEENKQSFLKSPSLANFLEGESQDDLENDPIVTQKGFLARINRDQGTDFDSTRFTSIADFLALDFEGQLCLLKESLFSEDAQKAAAVRLFAMKCDNTEVFRGLPFKLTAEEKKSLGRLQGRNLSELGDDEKRIVLQDELKRYLGTAKLKLDVKKSWEEVIERLTENPHDLLRRQR